VKNCSPNQIASTSAAGREMTTIRRSGIQVSTRARGQKTRYAPITPAIAPDAPMIGWVEPRSESAKAPVATIPATR
jgi:hypothetical protein